MPGFVNNSALTLERWSGFRPCSDSLDCALSEASRFDFLVVCRYLTEGPVQSQKYCLCDLSLGGEFCSIVTEAAVKRIVCYAVCILIALWPLLLGMWEIKERRKIKKKINAVYVSLWIATASGIVGLSLGLIGISMIVAGPATPGIAHVRAFQLILILPLCIATSFSSAMIISLEFRKVAHDPALGGNWNQAKEQRARSFVVATCVSIVMGYAIVYILTTIEVAAIVVFIFVFVGAVFSLSSGRQFNRIAPNFVGSPKKTRAVRDIARSFKAAIIANRQTSVGLCGTVLSLLLTTIVQLTAGSSIREDGFKLQSGILVMVGFFLCVTSYASINFGRQVRLIRHRNQPKTKTTQKGRTTSHKKLFVTTLRGPSKVAVKKICF